MKMNDIEKREIVDLLFLIDETLSIIKQYLEYINKVENLNELYKYKNPVRYSTNDLLFYMRALMDKLEDE